MTINAFGVSWLISVNSEVIDDAVPTRVTVYIGNVGGDRSVVCVILLLLLLLRLPSSIKMFSLFYPESDKIMLSYTSL